MAFDLERLLMKDIDEDFDSIVYLYSNVIDSLMLMKNGILFYEKKKQQLNLGILFQKMISVNVG